MKTIPLTQGKVAIVDDSDFDDLNCFKWRACKQFFGSRVVYYARRWERGNRKHRKMISMHSHLVPEHKVVDHRNGNGLDNRRSNLRDGTRSKNQQNMRKRTGLTSRFKGVSRVVRWSNWQANIRIIGKQKFLGNFASEKVAAKAYDAAAEKYFGEFALTNKAMNIS